MHFFIYFFNRTSLHTCIFCNWEGIHAFVLLSVIRTFPVNVVWCLSLSQINIDFRGIIRRRIFLFLTIMRNRFLLTMIRKRFFFNSIIFLRTWLICSCILCILLFSSSYRRKQLGHGINSILSILSRCSSSLVHGPHVLWF